MARPLTESSPQARRPEWPCSPQMKRQMEQTSAHTRKLEEGLPSNSKWPLLGHQARAEKMTTMENKTNMSASPKESNEEADNNRITWELRSTEY